ncbi:hypothetical protein BDN72DRAFT_777612, partial [Pluteus cervinus]
ATPQQLEAHAAASRRGALEGTAASGLAALAGSYYLHHRSPTYRQMPISLKALGVVLVVAPCLAIQAERRGLEYDRSQWEGDSIKVLDEKHQQEEKHWQSLSSRDRVADWAARHQYSIIIGGWATSMAIAGAIISRNRYQSTAQKIVQARMWAQGLTIGLLIGAGALTHTNRDSPKHDHSWRDLLDQQERDRQEALKHSQRAYAA